MKNNDKITLTIGQLKKLIKEAKEASGKTWYGVPGTKWIWHGDWADSEVEYHGEKINANELEDYAWDQYKQECKEKGKKPSEEEFDYRLPVSWFKKKLDEFMLDHYGDVDESMDDINDSLLMPYSWSINELEDDGFGWETYRNIETNHNFATAERAYEDGLKYLKLFDKGHYELEIWNSEDDLYNHSAEIHDGDVTEF